MKELRLRTDRIKFWLASGAQPTDTVAVLLWKAGLIPAPPVRFQPTKSTPRAERGLHTQTDSMGSVCIAGRPVQHPAAALASVQIGMARQVLAALRQAPSTGLGR